MANVKVFADKQTGIQTNRWAQNYIFLIYLCGGIKISAWFKLEAFTAGKLNVIKNIKFFFQRVETTMRKRKNCWLTAFSLLPTMFSKAFFLKSLDCVVKC